MRPSIAHRATLWRLHYIMVNVLFIYHGPCDATNSSHSLTGTTNLAVDGSGARSANKTLAFTELPLMAPTNESALSNLSQDSNRSGHGHNHQTMPANISSLLPTTTTTTTTPPTSTKTTLAANRTSKEAGKGRSSKSSGDPSSSTTTVAPAFRTTLASSELRAQISTNGTRKSFGDRYKFKFFNKRTSPTEADDFKNIDYSLPSWFNYDLYKKHYGKRYSNDERQAKMRRNIYLQTALKVLDYRARFRAKKFKYLVFINELADLTNDEVWLVTHDDKVYDPIIQRNDTACCSYEQAIEKLRAYFKMTDSPLQRAIIEEISENELLPDPPDKRISYVGVDGAKAKPPFAYSQYHKEAQDGQERIQAIRSQPSILEEGHKIEENNGYAKPGQQKAPLHDHDSSVAFSLHGGASANTTAFTDRERGHRSRIEANLARDSQSKSTFNRLNVSSDANHQHSRENDDKSFVTSRSIHTTSSWLKDTEATQKTTSKNLSPSGGNESSKGIGKQKEDQAELLRQHSLASRDPHMSQPAGMSDQDRGQEGEEVEKEDTEMVGIRQAIEDQILEQFKSQVGEQLRQRFSQQFGLPVNVRPGIVHTISSTTTTTLHPSVDDMDSIDYRWQQEPRQQTVVGNVVSVNGTSLTNDSETNSSIST